LNLSFFIFIFKIRVQGISLARGLPEVSKSENEQIFRRNFRFWDMGSPILQVPIYCTVKLKVYNCRKLSAKIKKQRAKPYIAFRKRKD